MSARPPIADRRSWTALVICLVIIAGLIWRWHRLAWLFGVIMLLLLGRALAMVLAAKASMSDPEEALEKDRESQ